MEFGIAFANTLQFTERDGLVELARSAEAAGFDSLWTVEHVIYPDGYESEYPYDRSGKMAADASSPIPDPLIWLSFVAAATSTLRLGTGILILPQRNPLILAKEVATLDRLSGGRVELGVGVGWLREEFDALGVPFERRGARTDEWIEVMRALWSDDHVDFDGLIDELAQRHAAAFTREDVAGIVAAARAEGCNCFLTTAGGIGGQGDLGALRDIAAELQRRAA